MTLPFPLLLDENVPDEASALLKSTGANITTAAEEGLRGRDDSEIIERARSSGRVVVTQDPDFGRMALLQGARCRGVIILRPGHLKKEIIADTLDRLFASFPEITPPFLIVVTRRGDNLHIRPRSLS